MVLTIFSFVNSETKNIYDKAKLYLAIINEKHISSKTSIAKSKLRQNTKLPKYKYLHYYRHTR